MKIINKFLNKLIILLFINVLFITVVIFLYGVFHVFASQKASEDDFKKLSADNNEKYKYEHFVTGGGFDIAFQLRPSDFHKKIIDDSLRHIIDDKYLIGDDCGFKEIFGNSLVRFFLKTSFTAVVKEIMSISFLYSAGENFISIIDPASKKSLPENYLAVVIFSFSSNDMARQLYEIRKDLFDALFYDAGGDSTAVTLETEEAGIIISYPAVKNKISGPAIFVDNAHLVFIYDSMYSEAVYIKTAKKIHDLINGVQTDKNSSGNSNLSASRDKTFKIADNKIFEAADFIFKAGERNFNDENGAAMDLIKDIFITGGLKDDLSTLNFNLKIKLNSENISLPEKKCFIKTDKIQPADLTNSYKTETVYEKEIMKKTITALRFLFSPLENSFSAADRLPQSVLLLMEFNFNFNSDFLSIIDVFVFRGIFLTVSGIDYVNDFLSWFAGGLFIALDKTDIDISALFMKRPLKFPEFVIGFKMKKNTTVKKDVKAGLSAEEFAGGFFVKLIDFISEDTETTIDINSFDTCGVKLMRAVFPAGDFFTGCEVVFGPAGDYYLAASSLKTFERYSASLKTIKTGNNNSNDIHINNISGGNICDNTSNKDYDKSYDNYKAAAGNFSRTLSSLLNYKNCVSGGMPGHFFCMYFNYDLIADQMIKYQKLEPIFKIAAAFPLAGYSLCAAIEPENIINFKCIFSINKKKLDVIVHNFNLTDFFNYLNELEKSDH